MKNENQNQNNKQTKQKKNTKNTKQTKEIKNAKAVKQPKNNKQPKATKKAGQQETKKVSKPETKKVSKPVKTEKPRLPLKIIPLGGLEEIGLNMTVFEYGDDIFVIDCGLGFPENDMHGIDLIIPDVTYLEQNIEKVRGFVITHGHEDHIGALSYILQKVNVPVYATKLTMGLIDHKLEERDMLKKTRRKVVRFGGSVTLGAFRVEFIKTNHSIQDAAALAIYTPVGTVIHTGDFKIDYTPVFGDAINLSRFAELGRKGVLALLSDSTNAERPGFTMSEKSVGKTIDSIFAEHPKNRLLIATFASNVDRVQQIINSAQRFGRKVIVEGRSMVNIISIASELGYLDVPEGILIDASQADRYEDDEICIISTGSQGESMAALSRMSAGTHKKIRIADNDVIVFSSHPVPGNEKAVSRVINELTSQGAEVIFQDVHVSGHACREDLKLIYSLVQPRFAIPVHGEYRHLAANAGIAEELGIPKDRIFILHTGDVMNLTEDSAVVDGKVQTGTVLVDGLGVGDVGNIVMKDRQRLAEDGIMVVALTLDKKTHEILAGPEVVSRGFVYVKESEELMDEVRFTVREAVKDSVGEGFVDWNRIKTVTKDMLGDLLWKKIKRRPMILPLIMEAQGK